MWDFLKFDLDLYKLPPNTHLTNCPLSRLSTYLFSYFPTLPLSHLSSCPFGHLPTCLLLGLTRPSFALLTSSQLWTVKIMRVQGEIYQSHINCQSWEGKVITKYQGWEKPTFYQISWKNHDVISCDSVIYFLLKMKDWRLLFLTRSCPFYLPHVLTYTSFVLLANERLDGRFTWLSYFSSYIHFSYCGQRLDQFSVYLSGR